MRVAQAALILVALMLGVIGHERVPAAFEVGAQAWSASTHEADQSDPLASERCMAMPSRAAHPCHCSECRSAAARPNTPGLRRSKQVPDPAFLLGTSFPPVGAAPHRIALNPPDNGPALPSGRDLLGRTARLLI
jgi:hypothetical protein